MERRPGPYRKKKNMLDSVQMDFWRRLNLKKYVETVRLEELWDRCGFRRLCFLNTFSLMKISSYIVLIISVFLYGAETRTL